MIGRRLTATPVFTGVVVITLAIGIGVTTAAYSALRELLSGPAGVRTPQQLARIHQRPGDYLSRTEVASIRDSVSEIAELAEVTGFGTSVAAEGRAAVLAHGEAVSGNLFHVLGVDAVLGRVIGPADDVTGAPDTAVLSFRLWRQWFGGTADVIGASIRMRGRAFTVIGVTGRGFRGAGATNGDVWIPISSYARRGVQEAAGGAITVDTVLGRLASGRSVADLAAAVRPASRQLDAVALRPNRTTVSPGQPRLWVSEAYPPSFWAGHPSAQAALVILSLPALVFLVASTNIANLALTRGTSRREEFLVRRALGASAWQLVRPELADGLTVAGAAGGLGAIIAQAILVWLSERVAAIDLGSGDPTGPFQLYPGFDGEVLVVVTASALLAFLVATAVPALHQVRRESGLQASGSAIIRPPRWRGRSNVIALQVAASVSLFLIMALGVTVLSSSGRRGTGRAELSRVGYIRIQLGAQAYDQSSGQLFASRVLDSARRANPGLVVGAASGGIFRGARCQVAVTATGPGGPAAATVNAREVSASPDVLPLLQLSERPGRGFEAGDAGSNARVAVVNRHLGTTLFDSRSPIGREIRVEISYCPARQDGERVMRVVGVVDDARLDHVLYIPLTGRYYGDLEFLAGGLSHQSASEMAAALRAAVGEVDPDVALSVESSAALAAQQPRLTAVRLAAELSGVLAMIALALATSGLYGVLSHVVAERSHEMGVRMAIGADAARIRNLVLKDGLRPVAEGLVIGCGVAALIRASLQSVFEQHVSAVDLTAIALAATPIVVTAAVVCYLPARRAARIEPSVILRDR